TPKAPPRSAREPCCRAPSTSSGAAMRSSQGNGSSPMNAKPKITTMSPATILRSLASLNRPPAAPAAAPSATKTAVKPAMNGMLATATRLPPIPTCVPETAERYPGTSGSTHGVTKERRPAAKASGIFVSIRRSRSSVEAGELFVQPALELWVERSTPVARRGQRSRPLPLAAPPPREEAEGKRAGQEPDERQEPGK